MQSKKDLKEMDEILKDEIPSFEGVDEFDGGVKKPKPKNEKQIRREAKKKVDDFNKEQVKLRSNLFKLSKKGISSFCFVAVDGGSSGGFMGDAGSIVEALYISAKNNPQIFAILQYSLDAVKAQRLVEEENVKENSISKLYDLGIISNSLYDALDNLEILSIEQLEKFDKSEVAGWKRIGKSAIDSICKLMDQRGLSFKDDVESVVDEVDGEMEKLKSKAGVKEKGKIIKIGK